MNLKKVLVISSFDGLIKQQFESGNLNKIYSNTNYRKQKINKRLKFFRKKNKLLKFITQYVKD